MAESTKYLLNEDQIPKNWYNIAGDLPAPPPPPINPATGQPVGPDDLAPLFAMEMIMQEMSAEREIPIPEPVREAYKIWRPTPLVRAHRLEKVLDTPAKIYYKNESVSPAGSHKPNTAVAQAHYFKEEGTTKLTTETGAGQWGTALAFAGKLFGLEVEAYQVRVSFETKPYRRMFMEAYGATCYPSPSRRTNHGRALLDADPDDPGNLATAVAEAIEMAMSTPGTKYALGSLLNCVCIHQTVVGQESMLQLEMADDYPDVVIGCVGGGSNWAGMVYPFLGENIRNGKNTRIVAVESATCPSLTRGVFAYDYPDSAHFVPLIKMHTLGSSFKTPKMHAGGLRYHGMGPMCSYLYDHGYVEAQARQQVECLEAALVFAHAEGTLPAPESSHAVKVAIEEALRCKEEGKSETILFNLSGHGYLDLTAYQDLAAGVLEDVHFSDEDFAATMADLPQVAAE